MFDLVVNLPRRALLALVCTYRLLLSPWLGSSCRFDPTCSAYAEQALENYGAMAGSWLTLGRLARCHPFCAGGHDPLPGRPPALFRHFAADVDTGGPTVSSNPEPRP